MNQSSLISAGFATQNKSSTAGTAMNQNKNKTNIYYDKQEILTQDNSKSLVLLSVPCFESEEEGSSSEFAKEHSTSDAWL